MKEKIILFICLIVCLSCQNSDNMKEIKDSNYKVTDLPWLKAKVDELTSLFQDDQLHVAIYQCRYGDEQVGFLEDRGNVAFFYSIEGKVLCAIGGFAGAKCPDELRIDFAGKKLIWEINNQNQTL